MKIKILAALCSGAGFLTWESVSLLGSGLCVFSILSFSEKGVYSSKLFLKAVLKMLFYIIDSKVAKSGSFYSPEHVKSVEGTY